MINKKKILALSLLRKIFLRIYWFFLYKFIYRFMNFYSKFFLSLDKITNEQENIFIKFGLNRHDGENLYCEYKKNKPELIDSNMESEHQILFASISKSQSINNILEIGTYNGYNAAYLSYLFPNSNILTLELPADDETYLSTYRIQKDPYKIFFIKKRDELIDSLKNVQMLNVNSFKLIFENNKKFDLIFIDGSHIYPYVAFDLANSLRLLQPNGFVILDDIIFTQDNQAYASNDMLQKLEKDKILNYELIYKNINKSHSFLKSYIAVIKN